MNTGAPQPETETETVVVWPSLEQARARVLGIQTKLHRWATEDADRWFADLFNLVGDPAFLLVGWDRVKTNKGARTAGVDAQTAWEIGKRHGEARLLTELRADLKAGRFRPLPVRERLIPKPDGRLRRLGIPTVRDRVVQASLKLVLEPIFEAEFLPCSYGFRPGRSAHDAIADIHHSTRAQMGYDWVVEGDITACFDRIDHAALLGRVRRRIQDKRVVTLVKAFCKAGILTQDGAEHDTTTGTPQGGILSPLLANIALSVLDEHYARVWAASTPKTRHTRRKRGGATWRLVRYADDFVLLVNGTRQHAEQLTTEVAGVLATMGLELSAAKTKIVHLDEGFDFLGFRIQRQHKPGTSKRYVYTFPTKQALMSVKAKVRALTNGQRNRPLRAVLFQLAPILRGWATYFRHGVSSQTFSYLRHFTWRRVVCWLRRKHPHSSWRQLRRRFLPGWWPTDDDVVLYDVGKVTVSRYRYRGAKIPTPWTPAASTTRG